MSNQRMFFGPGSLVQAQKGMHLAVFTAGNRSRNLGQLEPGQPCFVLAEAPEPDADYLVQFTLLLKCGTVVTATLHQVKVNRYLSRFSR